MIGFTQVFMTSGMIFPFTLLECHIYAAIFLLKYFTLHLEQKYLRIARITSTCNRFRTLLKFWLTELRTKVSILWFEVFKKFNDTFITFISAIFWLSNNLNYKFCLIHWSRSFQTYPILFELTQVMPIQDFGW